MLSAVPVVALVEPDTGVVSAEPEPGVVLAEPGVVLAEIVALAEPEVVLAEMLAVEVALAECAGSSTNDVVAVEVTL